MPVYHSGKLSRTGRPDFNYPLRPMAPDLTVPFGPRNPIVTSPYVIGATDIRWDNPRLIPQNNGLQITGVNVYRSIESPYGPYELITDSPVGVLFYRDQTVEALVTEDVTATLRYVLEPDAYWRVYAQHKPIVRPDSNGTMTDRVEDVRVEIDSGDGNFLDVPAFTVNGKTGEIVLISKPTFNYAVEQVIPPRLPWPPNGKVRLTYRYLKHAVLSVLGQRIFYKVTTVAVDPTDNSKRIETPLDEVEFKSTADIEEIDWIWREAMHRNGFILEQGGERVKVFVRRSMGEKCAHYQYAYGQSYNDCPVCFAPGTLINTETGWHPIESIDAGDRVLSSDGYYHKVKGAICRPYKGDMLSILSSVNTNPLVVTPEHPFLVLRSTHNSHSSRGRKDECGPKCNTFIERGDGNAFPPNVRKIHSGKWWARAQIGGHRGKGRVSLGTYRTREEAVSAVNKYKQEHWTPMHQLAWDTAKNINERDWLTPQWNSEIRDIETIQIPERFVKTSKFGPRRIGATEFKVDSEFLWVVGMYIAEGSNNLGGRGPHGAGGGSIQFSLHQDEKSFQDRIVKFFNRYGYNPTISFSKIAKAAVVTVNSSSLGKWFPEWLGHLCYNKHIPQELMYLPKDKTRMLIKGIHDGDGLKNDNEIIQTSEILCLQLVELLHRIGEQPLVRKQISNALTPIGNRRREAYCVGWAEEDFDHVSRKKRWAFKGHVLAHVKEIKKFDYEGPVYNLEVEGDPTYIVNGIVAHNCYGTNYVGGYVGPIDIMIAPPEAEKAIELLDMGLHIRYDYESWTMAFPLLKERDVIVRQSNERFIVGPVNYQGARGATYQQHFTIAYIDEGDIRYRIPITGGETSVPPSTDLYREERKSDASPVINDKPGIPPDRIIRGKTVVFENITF